jgi:predicted LPLAT superfamily acyltransferase
MTVAAEDDTVPAEWLAEPERGTSLGIRFFVWLITLFGRGVARAFLRPVVFWYAVFAPSARRASRKYLARLGVPHGFGAVVRHFLRFADCSLDRLFFAQGRNDLFDVRLFGHDLLVDLAERKQGAILLGAHLGSFEALRAQSVARRIEVHVVVNNSNARKLQATLRRLDPQSQVKLVELGDGGVDFIFRIRELVERGALVAVMGDRIGRDGRAVTAPFLGTPARFPAGPYLLAAVLRCPVYLTIGLYRGAHRYDLHAELFADRIDLPRKDREAALTTYATKYAAELERWCRQEPLDWFNFFDVWEGR